MSETTGRSLTGLDPLLLAQLGSLELKARHILDGYISGHYIRRIRGSSQEFSEHKPYNVGDDPKLLDWKIFARTDRLVTKTYQDESNIVGHIVMDTSSSMGFSHGGRVSKLEYAKLLAGTLGYLLISQHDAVGFATDQKKFLPVRGRSSLPLFFSELESLSPSGTSFLEKIITNAPEMLKRKHLVMIFSDLMQDPTKIERTLRGLHANNHDVMVFQILDPAELDLPYDDAMEFTDMETQRVLVTEPALLKEAYKKWVAERIELFAHFFKTTGIEYAMFSTDTPFDKGLGAYLSWRQSLL